jgi:hypothetical protein
MKKNLNLIAIVIFVLLIAGCAGSRGAVYSSLFDHGDISLSIREFSKEGAKIDYTGNPIMFEYVLAAKIEKNLKKKFVEVKTISPKDIPASDLLLEGRFVTINEGNRGLRYTVGFGAGKTTLAVEGRLMRVKDKKVLIEFEHKKHAWKGAFGGSGEDLLNDNIEDMAEEIAEFIEDPIRNKSEIDNVRGGLMFNPNEQRQD